MLAGVNEDEVETAVASGGILAPWFVYRRAPRHYNRPYDLSIFVFVPRSLKGAFRSAYKPAKTSEAPLPADGRWFYEEAGGEYENAYLCVIPIIKAEATRDAAVAAAKAMSAALVRAKRLGPRFIETYLRLGGNLLDLNGRMDREDTAPVFESARRLGGLS
jgi:hypothetical protein